MKYELIDHTADFGIRVFGTDLKNLFENAAHALFHMIANVPLADQASEYDIELEGEDLPDLMAIWMRELLFFWTGREMLVSGAEIKSLSENSLSGKVRAVCFDPDIHEIRHEIKAVTYHNLSVDRTDDGWEATLILDV